jgi:signal transduction histidine kinase
MATRVPAWHPQPPGEQPFNLLRWFGLASFVSIAIISVGLALLISRFLSDQMLRHDAVLMMQFVQNIVVTEEAAASFEEAQTADMAVLDRHFRHMAEMRDVVRANVHRGDRTILWSSEHSLQGQRFDRNPELDKALGGELVVESGIVDPGALKKPEHKKLEHQTRYYVETYIPIRDASRTKVIGAVEIYKIPQALFDAIAAGQRLTWLSAALGGLFLYGALFWLVARADGTIRRQRERLLEVETLAVAGEMGAAVAHGIRNPLASIRSSAELMLESHGEGYQESAEDIIQEVDRLGKWVRDLLSYSSPVESRSEPVHLSALVGELLVDFRREMEKHGVETSVGLSESLPPVRGDAGLLTQVLTALLANAVEAMAGPGRVTLQGRLSPDGRRVELTIADTGPGMARERLRKAFKPFQTTKARGLGLGLPLAKRIVERLGGRIALQSEPGSGMTVLLELPVAT